jgi:predicted lysophospholipase L1 biosynthesis ABC-type transport system permease subunit
VALLGLLGSVPGVAIAAGAIASIPPSLSHPSATSELRPDALGGVAGMAVGILVARLFARSPLLEVRRIAAVAVRGIDRSTSA